MCTVTLFPLPSSEKGFVLTSNRDEAVARQTLPPQEYIEDGVRLLYPKDVQAGGTWIGLSEKRRAICLLNGGFKSHIPNPPYRKSRGEVVKDFLKTEDLNTILENYLLENIEPFTMIIVDWAASLSFLEFVWDGQQRHLRELEQTGHIYSSASLYSPEVISHRRQRFEEFNQTTTATPETLLDFHTTEGSSEIEAFLIDRGFLKTVSITQITQLENQANFYYRDLSKDLLQQSSFIF